MELQNSQIVQELGSAKYAKKKKAILTLVESFCVQDNVSQYLSFIIERVIKEENYFLKIFYYNLLSYVSVDSFFLSEDRIEFLEVDLVKEFQTEKNTVIIGCIAKLLNNLLLENPNFFSFFKKKFYPILINKLKDKSSENNISLFLEILLTFVEQHPIFRNHDQIVEILFYCFQKYEGVNELFQLFQLLNLLIFKKTNNSVFLHEDTGSLFPQSYINNASMKTIIFFSSNFSLLLKKLLLLPLSKRYVGTRCLSLFLISKREKLNANFFVKEVLMEMLETSLMNTFSVFESGFCIFFLTYHYFLSENYLKDVISKYCFLLRGSSKGKLNMAKRIERGSSFKNFKKEAICKDICVIINFLREKYYVNINLFDEIKNLRESHNRILILIIVFRSIVQDSIKNKLKQILNKENYVIRSEKYLRKEFFVLDDQKKEYKTANISVCVQNEIFFCLLNEFLNQNPFHYKTYNEEVKKSWYVLGINLIKMIQNFIFVKQSLYNSCISKYGKVLFILLKNVNIVKEDDNIIESLKDYLKELLKNFGNISGNIYARFIILFILSYNISFSFKILTGEDSKEVILKEIFSFISFLIKKRNLGVKKVWKIRVLSNCMINIARKYKLKLIMEKFENWVDLLKNANKFRNSIEKKEEIYEIILFSFRKLNFLKKFETMDENFISDNYLIFSYSNYTKYDKFFYINYVYSLYESNEMKYNLFTKREENKKCLMYTINNTESASINRKFKDISFPNDPFLILMNYHIVKKNQIVIEIKIENLTPIEFENFFVEIISNNFLVNKNKIKVLELKPKQSKTFLKKFFFEGFKEIEIKALVTVVDERDLKYTIRTNSIIIYINKFLFKPLKDYFWTTKDFLKILSICNFNHSLNVLLKNKNEINEVIDILSNDFQVISNGGENFIIKRGMMKVCLISQTKEIQKKFKQFVLLTIFIEKYYEGGSTYQYIANFKFYSNEKEVITRIGTSRWLNEKLFKKFQILNDLNNVDLEMNIFSSTSCNLKLDLKEHYNKTENVMDVFFRKKIEKIMGK